MEQESINERLKFLVTSLSESSRAFSEVIGESPTNTHNYTTGDTRPKPEYLKKVLLQFRNINAYWLMTGEGEPFIGDAPTPPVSISNKKNKGPVQNNTGDHNTITNNVSLDSCKRDLAAAKTENELLRQQLVMAQALLEAKEETLSLLRSQFNRPN